MPEKYRITGITRQANLEISDLLLKADNKIILEDKIELCPMDLQSTEEFKRLGERLLEIEKEFGEETQRLFYLSVPPQISRPIIEEILAARSTIDPVQKAWSMDNNDLIIYKKGSACEDVLKQKK